jgi:hypothetical protein
MQNFGKIRRMKRAQPGRAARIAVGAALAIALAAMPVRAQQVVEKKPIGTFSAGWTYLWADQGNHYRSNLNGWTIRPAVNFPRGYSAFFSNTNYYGTNAKGSLNSHGFTWGVSKGVFARPRFKPAVFAEVGVVRSSSAGTITKSLLVAAGTSVSIPLNRHVSLTLLPAEYIFQYPHGDWRNNYNCKVGLSFPIGRR